MENVKWHDTKMDRQVKSNYRIAGVVHWAVLSRSSTLKKKLTELLSPQNKIIIVLKVYSMCFSRVHLPTSISLSASVIHTLTCAAWSITRLLRFIHLSNANFDAHDKPSCIHQVCMMFFSLWKSGYENAYPHLCTSRGKYYVVLPFLFRL